MRAIPGPEKRRRSADDFGMAFQHEQDTGSAQCLGSLDIDSFDLLKTHNLLVVTDHQGI